MRRLASRIAARWFAGQGTSSYPGAGSEDAQPEVRAAVGRFRALPDEERATAVSLWGWLLGDAGTPPYKMTRGDAGYVEHPVGAERCGNCGSAYLHVVSETYICDRMRGAILPHAWCERWNAPVPESEYVRYQEGDGGSRR